MLTTWKQAPWPLPGFFYIATFNDDPDLQNMTITINSADSFLLKFLMFSLLLRVIMLYLFRASRYSVNFLQWMILKEIAVNRHGSPSSRLICFSVLCTLWFAAKLFSLPSLLRLRCSLLRYTQKSLSTLVRLWWMPSIPFLRPLVGFALRWYGDSEWQL